MWRSHPDNAILKRHLKDRNFVAYQQVVDNRVAGSTGGAAPDKKEVEVKAVVNDKVETLKIYQPDLFDKTNEASKESKERFEVLFRKLLGEKTYRKVKDRILFYETTEDALKAGWRSKESICVDSTSICSCSYGNIA